MRTYHNVVYLRYLRAVFEQHYSERCDRAHRIILKINRKQLFTIRNTFLHHLQILHLIFIQIQQHQILQFYPNLPYQIIRRRQHIQILPTLKRQTPQPIMIHDQHLHRLRALQKKLQLIITNILHNPIHTKTSSEGVESWLKSTDSNLLALILRYLRYCSTCAAYDVSSMLLKKLNETSSQVIGISRFSLISLKFRELKSLKQLQLALTRQTWYYASWIYFNRRSYWWLTSRIDSLWLQRSSAVSMRISERSY